MVVLLSTSALSFIVLTQTKSNTTQPTVPKQMLRRICASLTQPAPTQQVVATKATATATVRGWQRPFSANAAISQPMSMSMSMMVNGRMIKNGIICKSTPSSPTSARRMLSTNNNTSTSASSSGGSDNGSSSSSNGGIARGGSRDLISLSLLAQLMRRTASNRSPFTFVHLNAGPVCYLIIILFSMLCFSSHMRSLCVYHIALMIFPMR
jgi:hypothetical protein